MLKIKSKTQKGITLIALIVTIIVLLILAGVSINMVFSNGGILDKAKSAEKRSTIAREKEIVEMAYLAVSTENVGGEITLDDLQAEIENMVGANKTVTTLDENGYLLVKFLETGNEYNINEMGVGKTAEETFSEIATETKIYTDENGITAVIPKGFAVGTSSTINKVDNGLVIQDKDGNQFVWIPAVGYVGNGFYVGRYEAGSESERTENTATSPTPVVKRDKYVYNYVNYSEANSLCESMYSALDSVNAKLPNESDVEAMSNFIPQYDKINVIQKGNFYESSFSVTRGKYAVIGTDTQAPYSPINEESTELYNEVESVYNKQVNTQVIFTTGASSRNKVKNVFDIYGNVMEFGNNRKTNQDYLIGGSFVRNWWYFGGMTFVDDIISNNTYKALTEGRMQTTKNSYNKMIDKKLIYSGFRPVLYINESAYNF